MANKPIGANFIEGDLGVVILDFDGTDLGKTMDDASIEFVEDIKDIMFAQNGSQPADRVPTGQMYRITAKLGEPTWDRLQKLMRGVTHAPGSDSAKLGRNIYISGKATFAKVLKITRVNSDGIRETDKRYMMTFFLAFPAVNGAIGAFGASTQRSVDVVFDCFYDETVGHEAFGYAGFASSLGIS